MAKTLKKDKGAGEYAREAVKHWGSAARYGFAALAAKRRAHSSGNGSAEVASLAAVELPVQESIDIAVPVGAVYALCTQYDEYPEFLDRVESVESDGRTLQVTAKVGASVRELEIEVMDERPDERLDWQCSEGYEHSGVISLHPLAPRLTRLELTVERQPEGPGERLARRLCLPQRTIREELRRFKAYAELWEEAEEYEPADVEVEEEEEEEDVPEDDEELEEGEEFVEDEEPVEMAQNPE